MSEVSIKLQKEEPLAQTHLGRSQDWVIIGVSKIVYTESQAECEAIPFLILPLKHVSEQWGTTKLMEREAS